MPLKRASNRRMGRPEQSPHSTLSGQIWKETLESYKEYEMQSDLSLKVHLSLQQCDLDILALDLWGEKQSSGLQRILNPCEYQIVRIHTEETTRI